VRDLLAESSEWLARQHREYAAGNITYARGDAISTIPAGRTRFSAMVENSSGLFERVEVWVFLIHIEDMTLDNEPIKPAIGDRITQGDAGYEGTYEVMALPGESHWRWSDSRRNQFRIHAKKIGQNPT